MFKIRHFGIEKAVGQVDGVFSERPGVNVINHSGLTAVAGKVFGSGHQPCGFALLVIYGRNHILLSGIVAFEFLATGLGQAAYATYMAVQTNKRFTATQYAMMTSLMAIPGTVAAAITGYMAEYLGWSGFYIVCALVALPGMLLLIRIAPWGSSNQEIDASLRQGE